MMINDLTIRRRKKNINLKLDKKVCVFGERVVL